MKEPTTPTPTASGMTRRTAVKMTAIGLAGAGLGAGSLTLATRLGGNAPRTYRFFTQTEAALVIEICEQIIPRDDVAGATDAGVVRFIDRQLASVLARHQQDYRKGLAAFAQTCQKLHNQPFSQLSQEQKIAVMRRMEEGKVSAELWSGSLPGEFFRLIVDHTMQGFYGSPRHGGNRDYLSYKALGLDYPQVIGRNPYRKT